MRILVTGASGFVGSLLVPRLLAAGHDVVGLSREPHRVRSPAPLARGDALSGEGLAAALAGVEVAYYLIHSMERPPREGSSHGGSSRVGSSHEGSSHEGSSHEGSSHEVRSHEGRSRERAPFDERDRRAAENFATAAERAGVRRIVYLGGMQGGAHRSRHLDSRREVEQLLLASIPDSVALRASIVIGARSRSFRVLVHLVERMRVLTLPAWRKYRTQPIDERDVTELLLACATAAVGSRSLDVGGPDVLSYGEMIERIAELMLVSRPALGFGVSATGVTARVAAAIAGEDSELVLALMQSLEGDLLAADDDAAKSLGVELHSFDAAVEHALGEWERTERLAAR